MLLNDKDYQYLQMLDEKNRRIASKTIDYDLKSSRMSHNPESRQQRDYRADFNGDALTRGVE